MNDVVRAEPVSSVQAGDSRALMVLIERAATSADFDMDKLQKLLDLKERWDANEARKAYTQAMAAFKANPPEIVKDKHVKFQTSKGVTEYDHATLGAVCEAIIKGLAQHGISHRWDLAQNENRIKVTCVLTHAMGHSESTSLHSAPDDSGGKNSIQAIGSACAYLQRYTLLAATGLASMDADDDGKATGGNPEASNAPPAPQGYADWKKSIEAIVPKGISALQEAWGKANGFRGYAGTVDIAWWQEQKAKAAKVPKQGVVR